MHEYCFSDSCTLDVKVMISHLRGLNGACARAYRKSSSVSNFLGFLGQHPQMKEGDCILGAALLFRWVGKLDGFWSTGGVG